MDLTNHTEFVVTRKGVLPDFPVTDKEEHETKQAGDNLEDLESLTGAVSQDKN